MAYEKRDMSGSVFRNREKRSETHSDYTGDCLIDGQEFWMNCWEKKDKNGNTFFSFSFKKKLPRSQGDAPAKTQSKHDISVDDSDLPF